MPSVFYFIIIPIWANQDYWHCSAQLSYTRTRSHWTKNVLRQPKTVMGHFCIRGKRGAWAVSIFDGRSINVILGWPQFYHVKVKTSPSIKSLPKPQERCYAEWKAPIWESLLVQAHKDLSVIAPERLQKRCSGWKDSITNFVTRQRDLIFAVQIFICNSNFFHNRWNKFSYG